MGSLINQNCNRRQMQSQSRFWVRVVGARAGSTTPTTAVQNNASQRLECLFHLVFKGARQNGRQHQMLDV
jgi:hypothetical protein